MDDSFRQQLEIDILRKEITKDFKSFVNYFFPLRYGFNFRWNWHHEVMAEYVDSVVNGEIQYLVVNIPPRYTKTEFWSIFFPAYGLAKNAACKFINTSYSQSLVENNSQFVMDIIELEEYQRLFPETKLRKDYAGKKEWKNISDGGFKSVSTGGGITGFGAGCIDTSKFGGAIIIDDPLKPQDKESETNRPKCIEWFKNTLVSRRNNEEVPIIIVMQRLHEEDLSGWALSKACPYNFELLCMPVESEDGTPLWADKHNKRDIQNLKKLDAMMFAGQYLQLPAPAEGGIFKDEYWQYWSSSEVNNMPFETKIMTVDTSEGEDEQSDYTVMQLWGKYLNKAYLIDGIRVRADSEELKIIADAFDMKHKPNLRIVENYNLGTGLISAWKKQGKPVLGKKQSKSKVERANKIKPYVQAGLVYLNKDYEGLSDLLTELRNFPNAKNDDQVDCLTLAIDILLAGEGFMLYPEFQTVLNISSNLGYISSQPLLISWNAKNQPAYIFAQLTPWGQLRILDSDVSTDNKSTDIIVRCSTNQLINYNQSQNNFRLISSDKPKNIQNMFDLEHDLHQKFGQFPRIHEIEKLKKDIINLTASTFTGIVINPETGQREQKIIIHPRNELLIKALEGGVTYVNDDKGMGLIDQKINEVYPYYNLLNSLHLLIYDLFLAQKSEQRKKNKKEVIFKAVYNK